MSRKTQQRNAAWHRQDAGCTMRDAGNRASNIKRLASLIVAAQMLVALCARNASTQTPLQDLFNRIQEQNTAASEGAAGAATPFADDPATPAAVAPKGGGHVGQPMMLPASET